MSKRDGAAGAVGCLAGVVAGGVGFWVWLTGARLGVRGHFESERDWSLLYADLPVMLFGFPALTLAAFALVRARRWRLDALPGARAVLPVLVAAGVLAGLAWAGTEWLEMRVEPFANPG